MDAGKTPAARSRAGKRTREVARRSRYTPAERERGLTALALASGNSRRAAALLKEQGLSIPASTLFTWPQLYPDEYQAVREGVLPRVKAELAEAHSALAARQVEVSSEMTERLAKEMGGIPVRDLAGAIRNIDTGSGIHTQRAAELRGEPTIIEHRSLKEIIGGLERRGIITKVPSEFEIIEGGAEELPADGASHAA